MEPEITPEKQTKTITTNSDGGVAPDSVGDKKTGSGRDAMEALKSETNKNFSGEAPPEPSPDTDKNEKTPAAEKPAPQKDKQTEKPAEKASGPEVKQAAEGLVEVDGKKYFYHPQVHAEGEKTRPNSYPDRESAEDAAVHKIELMRERVNALKEAKKGIRTLGLPKILGDNPSKLEDLTEENVIAMDDQALREFIREADQFDLKAASKIDRIKSRQAKDAEKAQTTERFSTLQSVAEQTLAELQIDPQAKKYESTDAFFVDLDQAIEAQIDKELAPAVRELQDLEEDDDKLDDMGQREFMRMVKQKTLDLQEKREDLKRSYAEKKQRIQEFIDVAREVQGDDGKTKETKLTDAEKARLRKDSITEFEEDMKEAGRELTPGKISAFSSWANRHRASYNDLVTTDDVYDAYHDYEQYISEKRQELRGKQLPADGSRGSGSRDDIKAPDPDRQIKEDRADRSPSKDKLKGLAKDLNQQFPFR